MTRPRRSANSAALAIGDQVQAVCDASGQSVLGFAVFLRSTTDPGGVSVEARTQLPPHIWNGLVRAYLDQGGAL